MADLSAAPASAPGVASPRALPPNTPSSDVIAIPVDDASDDCALHEGGADDDLAELDDTRQADSGGAADPFVDGFISSRLVRPSAYRRTLEPMAIAAPSSGAFWLYLGSGPRRDGDLASQMAALGGAPVVNIDIKVGGYDHDLTHGPTRVAVLELAQSARCLGAFISIPCKTFSVPVSYTHLTLPTNREV